MIGSFSYRCTCRYNFITTQEQISVECRKAKTKIITLANHKLKDANNPGPVNQLKPQVITGS